MQFVNAIGELNNVKKHLPKQKLSIEYGESIIPVYF